jgi:pSer/pThr/pTyr-binding forkhead associated (FHA) protein
LQFHTIAELLVTDEIGARNMAFQLKGPGGLTIDVVEHIVAGRNPDCDVVLTEGHPSRRHAQITVKDGVAWLEDLGSANGTFVNDQQVAAPVALRSGDHIRFHTEEWQFSDSAAAPNTPDAATVVVRRPPPQPVPAGTGTPAPAASEAPRSAAKNMPAGEAPKAAPAPPPPEPSASMAAATPNKSVKAPESWADPDRQSGPGTKLFDPQDLKRMLGEGSDAAAAAVAGGDVPMLVIRSGRRAGETVRLESSNATSGTWSIGSDADRDIILADDGVSGRHATLRNDGKRWRIADQMSANGTFVNGAKVNAQFLSSGDRLRFGQVECGFQLPTGAARKDGAKRPAWLIGVLSFVATAIVIGVVWWLS